ncbi:MAG: hypothetical protein PHU25_17140, partial [Deltaproteobacteria bacterium]|nr:hypothetical protein [Deltaproteobacteria bacterium]
GIAGYLALGKGKGAIEKDKAVASRQTPGKTNEKNLGLGPDDGRFRDGAKRIKDPQEAIGMARDALTRVNREIDKAPDEVSRASLVRKKALIERSIENLEGSPARK